MPGGPPVGLDLDSASSLAPVVPRWPTDGAGSLSDELMRVRDVHWNAECRRAMQVLKAAWEDKNDEEEKGNKRRSALWRVADNEDALWLSIVWVQHDEHDVVVDINEATRDQRSKFAGNVKHALVTNNTNATVLSRFFLNSCSSLTALDITPLSKVTTIEEYFLCGCSSLTSLDISPLSNLTDIGVYFLSRCSSLTALDLSRRSNVTLIEEGFLSECSAMTVLDLSPLSKVTRIRRSFLADCTSLTSLDLSPLSNVTAIGAYFLNRCSALTSLDLSPLSNVTVIGACFLAGCSSLTALDLSPLSSVTTTSGCTVQERFLDDCSSLAVVAVNGLPADSPLRRLAKSA